MLALASPSLFGIQGCSERFLWTGQPGCKSLDFASLEFRFLIPSLLLYSPNAPLGSLFVCKLLLGYMDCILVEVRAELKSFTGLRSEVQ